MKILLSCKDIVSKEISVYLPTSLQLWVLYMTYCMVHNRVKFNCYLVQFSYRPVNHMSCFSAQVERECKGHSLVRCLIGCSV